jgi:hypothetical protein
MSTINEETETRLAHLTAQAIKHGHYRFVQWLIEMSIGKPKETLEHIDTSVTFNLAYTPPQKGDKNGNGKTINAKAVKK